jgi:prepilin-type N-terminal cleavage/methylation domain-containing protein
METAPGRTEPSSARPRERGFSLLEVLVVSSVMTLVLGGAFTVILRSERLVGDEILRYSLDETGRRVIDRLCDELRAADPSKLLPLGLADSSWVQFQRVTGYAGGVPQLAPPVTVAFQLAPRESANGRDDNGDGRVDEGSITLTVGSGSPVTLAGNILGFRLNGTTGGISFAVDVGLLDDTGALVQKTYQGQVSFRN